MRILADLIRGAFYMTLYVVEMQKYIFRNAKKKKKMKYKYHQKCFVCWLGFVADPVIEATARPIETAIELSRFHLRQYLQ